jgi:hypothetical protein
MQPSTQLPPEYQLRGEIDLSQNKKLALLLNLVGTILIFVFGALFGWLTLRLRPDLTLGSWEVSSISQLLKFVLVLIGLTIAQVTLHELVHGLFFWLATKSRPRYGFKGLYAYAAAPEWYLPRNRYLVVGLAPVVGMSLVGLLFISFVPQGLVLPLFYVIAINAAGSIGDLLVAGWLLFKPATTLIQDAGDAVAIYQQKARTESETNGEE